MALRFLPWRSALFVLALSCGNVTTALAHPHVFIDYAVTVIFDHNAVKAARLTWTFDDMYSSMLFHDYTSRPAGALTAADSASLRKNAFEDTADFHYFTDIKLNGDIVPVKNITDFVAQFRNHRMSYSFTVPIPAEASSATNILEIDSFDTEFYIDFELVKKDPVAVEGGDGLDASCAPRPARKTSTTFGGIDSVAIVCTFGRAK